MIVMFLEFVVFQFVLPATEIPNLTFDQEFLVKRFDKDGPREGHFTGGKWAENKVKWQVNNYGWMSHIDYSQTKSKPRIAVIGDSFVMPAEVATTDGFSQQLHELLKDSAEVYSFGVGSTPLSNYLEVAKLVKKRFSPDLIVVNIVYNDFEKSIFGRTKDKFWSYEVGEDTVAVHPPIVSWDKQHWYQSTNLYMYWMSNLGGPISFKRKRGKDKKRFEGNIDQAKALQVKEDIRSVTDYIVGQFRLLLPDTKIVFTMDAPRKAIYEGTLDKSKVIWLNEMMSDICHRKSIDFIDLTPYFQKDYERNKRRFEFYYDGHWNPYAHELVANILFQYVKNQDIVSTSLK